MATSQKFTLSGTLAEAVKEIAEDVVARSPAGGGITTIAAASDLGTVNLPASNGPLAAILTSLQNQINAIPGGGGGGTTGGIATAFSTAIKYDLNFRYYAGVHMVTSNEVYTRNETGAIPFGETTWSVQMNGSNTVDLTALGTKVGDEILDNVAGQQYELTAWKGNSGFFWGLVPGALVDVSKPAPTAVAVDDTDPLSMLITWSKTIFGTVSSYTAFAISAGHSPTAHAYVDPTHTRLTFSTPFVQGETARTLAYVVPGVNPMRDTAGTPNLADAFSGFAIANNVTTPTVTLSVLDASPTILRFTFSEAMNQTGGSTPAAPDFALSSGTLSGWVWDDSTNARMTRSTAFTGGEVVTLNYVPGTNKLKDLAGGNLLAAFTGKAINNQVVGSSGILSYTNETMPASIDLDNAGITDWIRFKSSGGEASNFQKAGVYNLDFQENGTLGVDYLGGSLCYTTIPTLPALLNAAASVDEANHGTARAGGLAAAAADTARVFYDNGGSTPSIVITCTAGTTQKTVDVIWGMSRKDLYSAVGAGNLEVSLSDASASPISIPVTNSPNDTQANVLRTRITFKAATNGQTLTIVATNPFIIPVIQCVLEGYE